VIFLIVLVGTSLEVLTERTRTNWRISQWRSKVAGAVIAVLRNEHLLAAGDREAEQLQEGDRLILIGSQRQPLQR